MSNRKLRLIVFALGIVGLLGFSGFSPLAYGDPLVVQEADVFSYQAPEGWSLQKAPNGKQIAAEMKGGSIAAMIDVEVDRTPGPLHDWEENSIAKNRALFAPYNPKYNNLTEFQTAAGVKRYKLIMTLTASGKPLENISYIFAGSNNAKIVASCTTAAGDAAHYEPIVDAAMKTFVAK